MAVATGLQIAVNYSIASNTTYTHDFVPLGPFIEGVLDNLRDENVLLVAATGNNHSTSGVGYPASDPHDNIISVGALYTNYERRTSSNTHPTALDLYAIGTAVTSTCLGGGYCDKSGSSIATPMVTGTAALAHSLSSSYTYAHVQDAIFGGVDPLPLQPDGYTGEDLCATGGVLNAYGAVLQLPLAVKNSNVPFGGGDRHGYDGFHLGLCARV